MHYFMQAATVLMLELSFRADHMPNEVEEIFDSAKKATDWLHSLSEQDEAARRAWSLCDEIMHKIAPKVGKSLTEASNYGGSPDRKGHAADRMQGIDSDQFAQGSATSSAYLPRLSSAPFHQPMFSSYDQFLSQGQMPTSSASESYNDIFPTAADMYAMQYDGHEHSGYFQVHNRQRWFPSDDGGVGGG